MRVVEVLRRDFNCAPHPGNDEINYDMNSKVCDFLKPGDKWYLIAAGSFCGLVTLILVIIWLNKWAKARAAARRLNEPNPANERTIDNLDTPLIEDAAPPGMMERYPYDEKEDPYAYLANNHPIIDPMANNPYLPNQQPPSSESHYSHNSGGYPGDVNAYAQALPLPSSSQGHSDYDYEYNSSQDHSRQPLQVDIPPSASHYSVLSPTEYATPDSYGSPDRDYHLRTPDYPDPGMRRLTTPAISDSYTQMPPGVSSGRSSVMAQINGSGGLPSFPPPVSTSRNGMRSPIKSPSRAGADTPSSQQRFLARYGRTPPVPERPMGLQRYASGLGSDEYDYDPEQVVGLVEPERYGGSSSDHSAGFGGAGLASPTRAGFAGLGAGSSNEHSAESHGSSYDQYLYEVPTLEAVNEAMNPFKGRRLYQ